LGSLASGPARLESLAVEVPLPGVTLRLVPGVLTRVLAPGVMLVVAPGVVMVVLVLGEGDIVSGTVADELALALGVVMLLELLVCDQAGAVASAAANAAARPVSLTFMRILLGGGCKRANDIARTPCATGAAGCGSRLARAPIGATHGRPASGLSEPPILRSERGRAQRP
jgi:hypothetical protein